MDRTRFNQHTPRTWRPIRQRESILLPDPGESRTQQRKQFFAIVSESISQEGKPIRRVLICDDNPASLRLLSNLHALDFEPREYRRAWWIVLSCLLVAVVGLGMLWPLM